MLQYRIGVLEEAWVNVTPPLQRATFDKNILELGTNPNYFDNIIPYLYLASKSDLIAKSVRCRTGQKSCGCLPENLQTVVNLPITQPPQKTLLSQDDVVTSFRNLIAEMKSEGMYVCKSSAYLPDVLRICTLFSIMLLLLRYEWYLVSAVFMGSFVNSPLFLYN